MLTPMPAADVLDREFLEIRAKILQVAASFDRIVRGEGDVAGDSRMKLVCEALDVLQGDASDRAEQVQLIFSRQYDDSWRGTFGIEQ